MFNRKKNLSCLDSANKSKEITPCLASMYMDRLSEILCLVCVCITNEKCGIYIKMGKLLSELLEIALITTKCDDLKIICRQKMQDVKEMLFYFLHYFLDCYLILLARTLITQITSYWK